MAHSLIYLVVKGPTFRPHFNGSHVLRSDSLRMQLPGLTACLVWWPQHYFSPFIWAQVSLISHLNCIIAKIFSWIIILPSLSPFLLNKTDILLPSDWITQGVSISGYKRHNFDYVSNVLYCIDSNCHFQKYSL